MWLPLLRWKGVILGESCGVGRMHSVEATAAAADETTSGGERKEIVRMVSRRREENVNSSKREEKNMERWIERKGRTGIEEMVEGMRE